jgi:DNA helicase II / ATP-dependent DNA helicase PcrA
MGKAHGGTVPLYEAQRRALAHSFTVPLWVIAGPGTGKTHTLVWLALKRILVDGVAPERIVLTTFTRKAASELQSRLAVSRQRLIDVGLKEAEPVDLSHLAVGTLHGLCARILHDVRYEPTLRIRVLEDELTQRFFIRSCGNPLLGCGDLLFWKRFGVAWPDARSTPELNRRAQGLCKLFNRITENGCDTDAMLTSADPAIALLAGGYRAYRADLAARRRTDQAHLQRHFLEFLDSAAGVEWLSGGRTVVVDEYQDTNPIQEEIYFRLAGGGGDLTVVGDDDQSLYRFRGATVHSLIGFDRACESVIGKRPTAVYLDENRRSHPSVVDWVNRYVSHHPRMVEAAVRVRAPDKPPLRSRAAIGGDYPAVMAIVRGSDAQAGSMVAREIAELHRTGRISDWSQVALLSYSTKETLNGVGAYTEALRREGVPIHNPRNRTAQWDRRLKAVIGALSFVLDNEARYAKGVLGLPQPVAEYVSEARRTLRQEIATGRFSELEAYVRASIAAIGNAYYDPEEPHHVLVRQAPGPSSEDPGQWERITVSRLLYKVLGHEPFASALREMEAGERLKALNMVLAEYEALYDEGDLSIERPAAGGPVPERTRITDRALANFYGVFVDGIRDGLNDPEDEDVSIQPGAVNVMTVHQSKGLEFEAVFLLRPDRHPRTGDTELVEDELEPFARRLAAAEGRPSPELRAAQDAVRLFFVAYSRAKRLLVLAGSRMPEWDLALGRTAAGTRLTSPDALRDAGVALL